MKKPGNIITLSKQEKKLIEASENIIASPPTGVDIAYIHAILCQVGLPRSKVEGREFLRRAGKAWLNVQAGTLDEGRGPIEQPIPYGATPRLALAWVSSHAVRHRTREIPIGETASEFLRLMGMENTGRRHATLRKQMHALAACRLQLGYCGRTFNGSPIEQFDAWLSDKETNQRKLWPGVIVLSESYYKTLCEHAVPLDNRALYALKGSSLALDVYVWLAYRLHTVDHFGTTLSWDALRHQFAQEYKGKNANKDFRKDFLNVLEKVSLVYPDALFMKVDGGLKLYSSPPPILSK